MMFIACAMVALNAILLLHSRNFKRQKKNAPTRNEAAALSETTIESFQKLINK